MASEKRMTKAQIYAEMAEKTGLSKKDVQAMFGVLTELIERELREGSGEFILPDLIKLKVKHIEARPEHVGLDPFTKEERTFPAKPASRKVRATPLKKLKDLIS